MTPATILEKMKNWAFKMAASFAVLAVVIPGVIIAFENEYENRSAVLVLTVAFLANSIIYSNLRGVQPLRLITVYLVIQTVLVIALIGLNPSLNFYIILFYVLSIEAIMALERRYSMMWLVIYIVLTIGLLVSLLPLAEAIVSLPIFLGGFFFFVTFANATLRANEARKESQRLLTELTKTNRQLQEYAMKAEQLAVSEERNRLSREMHDTIGHRLTVASVQLEGMHRLISKDPQRAESMAETVRNQVREALHELRRTVATLREPLEADLPLDVSIKRLTLNFEEATGLQVNLILPDQIPPLTNNQRLAMYRTAQEALTNTHKHAGATQVWLQVERIEEIISMRVSDNGIGLSEANLESGFGLRGIRERAAQLGGELKLETRTGGGAQVSLWLPI